MRYGPIPSTLNTHSSATETVSAAGLAATDGSDGDGGTAGDVEAAEVGACDAGAAFVPDEHPTAVNVSATAVTVATTRTIVILFSSFSGVSSTPAKRSVDTPDHRELLVSCHRHRSPPFVREGSARPALPDRRGTVDPPHATRLAARADHGVVMLGLSLRAEQPARVRLRSHPRRGYGERVRRPAGGRRVRRCICAARQPGRERSAPATGVGAARPRAGAASPPKMAGRPGRARGPPVCPREAPPRWYLLRRGGPPLPCAGTASRAAGRRRAGCHRRRGPARPSPTGPRPARPRG